MEQGPPGLGHNGGPTMEPGARWRRHCWTRARAELLPRMPLEIVRRRMRRARQLGLPFATYNRVRQTTGQDVVALLFSSNALVAIPPGGVEEARARKLRELQRCGRLVAVHPPGTPDAMSRVMAIHEVSVQAFKAPGLGRSWSETRDVLKGQLKAAGLPGDQVLIIGETVLEQAWTKAGGFAGFFNGGQYFADVASAAS